MHYLVNFSNQVAAGPRMIAKNFILSSCKSLHNFTFIVPNSDYYRSISTSSNVELIYINSTPGSFKSLFLVFYVNYYLINNLCKKYCYDGIIAFGNFYLANENNNVVLLLHHPYLVDDKLYNSLPLKAKAIEKIKRLLFKKGLKKVSKVIVQTSYMNELLISKYSYPRINAQIIHNPISDFFKGNQREGFVFKADEIKLFYPSRYYKHKNHKLALEVAKLASKLNLPITVYVTIDASISDGGKFLETADNVSNFINIGELQQEELVKYYSESSFMLFTSLSETYGNPLAESVVSGLPVIAPDLGYARSILLDSGNYFSVKGGLDSQAKEIINIVNDYNTSKYQQNIQALSHQKNRFPFVDDWFNRLMKLL